MFFTAVSADRCLVIFLSFLIAFLFLFFVRKVDGVRRSGGIGFDELHHLLHCICCALDECLHLTCMVLRQCCDEFLRCLGLFFNEIGFELFRVDLVCLFSQAYSVAMKVLMLIHVLSAAGLFSHSRTAALNSPQALKLYSAMSLCSFMSEVILALVSALTAFSTLLKYTWGFLLRSHSVSLSARRVFVSAKSNAPPLAFRWSIICLGVWFKTPRVSSSISTRQSFSTASRMISFRACSTPLRILY